MGKGKRIKLFGLADIDRELATAHEELVPTLVNNPDKLTEFKGMVELRDRLRRRI